MSLTKPNQNLVDHLHVTVPEACVAKGDGVPIMLHTTAGSEPARVRGHVKSLLSAREKLKALMSSES